MSKTYNGGAAVAIIFGVVAVIALSVLVFTWPAMIMFGVVHSYWAWLPAFGFWETLGVVFLVRMLTSSTTVNNNS